MIDAEDLHSLNEDWRRQEAQELHELIQSRIRKLQVSLAEFGSYRKALRRPALFKHVTQPSAQEDFFMKRIAQDFSGRVLDIRSIL